MFSLSPRLISVDSSSRKPSLGSPSLLVPQLSPAHLGPPVSRDRSVSHNRL